MTKLSRVRTYVAENAEWQQMQKVLLDHWKQDMENTHVLLMDATCYESYIRYPTDVKLLWECCQFIYEKLLFKYCKLFGFKRPRSKYLEQKKMQLSYAKRKKKSYKLGSKRKKSLLYLLEKGLGQLQEVLNAAGRPSLLNDQQRAYPTSMEGSFGDHKLHYGAMKIKTRGEKREKLWVFFAVMTANAVKMSRRKEDKAAPPLQQAA